MSPQTLIGASSSSSIGWSITMSRLLKQSILISASARSTNFPGLAPLTLKSLKSVINVLRLQSFQMYVWCYDRFQNNVVSVALIKGLTLKVCQWLHLLDLHLHSSRSVGPFFFFPAPLEKWHYPNSFSLWPMQFEIQSEICCNWLIWTLCRCWKMEPL